MSNMWRLTLLSVLLPSLMPAAALVTNFPINFQAGAAYALDPNRSVALVVEIGATPVRFEGLEAAFTSSCPLGSDCEINGGIYTDGPGTTQPGALLAAFNPVVLPSLTEESRTFTTAVTVDLAPNTIYWFLLEGSGVGSGGEVDWIDGGEPYTNSALAAALGFDTNTGGGWSGPVILNGPFDANDPDDGNPQAQLNGSTIPEPSTLALLGVGLASLMLRRRRVPR